MIKRWILVISIVLNIILSILLMRGYNTKPTVDYIPVHDTVIITKDSIQNKIVPLIVRDTLIQTDSVIVTKDGTYVQLPMKWSQYKDIIKNDTTSTEIDIRYHGIEAEIDSIHLVHNYFHKVTTRTIDDRRLHPYIGFAIGPKLNTDFKGIRGGSIEVKTGLIFKNGWGGEVIYELDLDKSNTSHEVKIGIIKQF